MKVLSLILFAIISISALGQTKNNTQIGEANTVNIYNGNVSIGKIIINESPGSKVYFSKYSQSIDTTKKDKGEYETIFTFFGEQGFVSNKVLTLVFDKQIIRCMLLINGSGNIMSSDGYNSEKTAYRCFISQLVARSFSIVVYSKEKVFTTIAGIAGQATQ